MAKSIELIEALCRIRDKDTMHRFLSEVLTPSEYDALNLRWELMKRLNQGETQRAVAAELGISLCKITRGAKIVHDPDSITSRLINGQRNSHLKPRR
jgi:TrpR family transcriptional regulator, trp operon repressor